MSLGPPLAVVFALGWVPLYAFRAESLEAALPYYSAAERRLVRLSPLLVSAHMTLACVLVSLAAPPVWRAGLGLAVYAGGIAFWLWARVQIGPLRRTRLPDEPPPELRRDGAFGLVRNPLYLGVLLAAAAPIVVAAQPALLLSYAPCALALALRAGQEERRLHAQLGPRYADYTRAVKRLIPWIW